MIDHKPYSVPKEPGRWRAITLAAVVHLALLIFFWIGIDWQSETPQDIQAEIWDPQARDAAPLPTAPEPKPEPQPEPKPVVKETPKVEPAPPPPPPKVDIALEQEKKRKEQERKDKLAQQEKEKKAAQDKKLAEEKKQKEKEKADQQKQAELDKKKKQDALDAKLREQARADEMKRLTGAVGSGGTGQAAKSQGAGRADAGYAAKIRAKVRSNTIFNVPENLAGNPEVEFDVQLLPDGSLRSLSMRKSSGIDAFDEAVKRAIERSQPFPPDQSGTVPGRLIIAHKPKD